MDLQSVSDIANVVIALIAIGTLGFSIWLSWSTQKQALEARYDAQRPMIIPQLAHFALDDKSHQPKWGGDIGVDFKNVGPGIATNMRARLYGTLTPLGQAVYVEFIFWKPFAQAEEYGFNGVKGEIPYRPESMIRNKTHSYPLVPEKEMAARLTITYRDIFNIKHASVFDYSSEGNWKSVDFLSHVEKDLEDIAVDDGKWAAQKTQELYDEIKSIRRPS